MPDYGQGGGFSPMARPASQPDTVTYRLEGALGQLADCHRLVSEITDRLGGIPTAISGTAGSPPVPMPPSIDAQLGILTKSINELREKITSVTVRM